jgi:hypothetical protein
VPLWFFGGSMIFTEVFLLEEELGCSACEMVGNGRRARDDGKEAFRRGIIRWVAVRPLLDESASGEDIIGRDIVIVAERVKEKLMVSRR